jgi:hypothetical protein
MDKMTPTRIVYYCNEFNCNKHARRRGLCQRHLNKNPFSTTNKKIDSAGKMRLICDIDDCTKRARTGFTKCFRHGGKPLKVKKRKLVSPVLMCNMKQIKSVPVLTVSDRRDHKLDDFNKRIRGISRVITQPAAKTTQTDTSADVDPDQLVVHVVTEMQQQMARVKSRMALHNVIAKDLNKRDKSMECEKAVQRMKASPFFSNSNI